MPYGRRAVNELRNSLFQAVFNLMWKLSNKFMDCWARIVFVCRVRCGAVVQDIHLLPASCTSQTEEGKDSTTTPQRTLPDCLYCRPTQKRRKTSGKLQFVAFFSQLSVAVITRQTEVCQTFCVSPNLNNDRYYEASRFATR